MKYFYELQLIDAVVLSQHSASTQNHLCLDYIPGSAILGCLAGKYYGQKQIDEQTAARLFHSGAVKFGPCYPFVNQQLALPVAASWYGIKGKPIAEKSTKTTRLIRQNIANQASPNFVRNDSVQYQQCRDGFINPQGELALVQQQWFTKTAINADTGRVEEGQLFNYAALSAGQTFAGWVECDEATWQQIKPLLLGAHRLGRSKGAEFGRIHIEILNDAQEAEPKCHGLRLTLWCLSDVQAVNQLGQPTYTPELSELVADVDFSGASFNKAASFIRTRQQSLFNQKRAGTDSEQLLIQKGSVLVYDLAKPLTQTQLTRLSQGVGINLQQGLGWLRVNPDWSAQAVLPDTIDSLQVALQQHSKTVAVDTNSALIRWLMTREDAPDSKLAGNPEVDSLCQSVWQAYKQARGYSGIRNSQSYGPNRTQWQRISSLLKQQDAQWYSKTFGSGNKSADANIIAKATNDDLGWGASWDNGQQFITFAEYCRNLFAKVEQKVVLKVLEKLSRYDLAEYRDLGKAAEQLGLSKGGEV